MASFSAMSVSEVLDFGIDVEKAFDNLCLSENNALKIKLLSRVAEESEWVRLFTEVGLTPDVASLISLIMNRSRSDL
jgi:hypothetical protein